MKRSDSKPGIAAIGSYVPESLLSNQDKKELFAIDDSFLNNKIGVDFISRKNKNEETSDLCIKAFEDLVANHPLDKNDIKCIVVVTQNPDGDGIPHTSAIVHGKLGLPEDCAAFDISLGCSGFVYGLSVIESFMSVNGLKTGLLFTCDPYSKIIDPNDKNTALLFGDAAAVVLINDQPQFSSLSFSFGTKGSEGQALVSNQGILSMDGRAVFNFSATEVPVQIRKIIEQNALQPDDIDLFLLHQGSKYIVDTIIRRLGVNADKVPMNLKNMGNTVSSSIPLLLKEYMNSPAIKTILVSGFGVGLSWASAILRREDNSHQ